MQYSNIDDKNLVVLIPSVDNISYVISECPEFSHAVWRFRKGHKA